VALALQDAYDFPDSPLVGLTVGGKVVAGQQQGGTDVTEVLGYQYTNDIIPLTDTATVDVANPDGKLTSIIKPGAPFTLWMADPKVNGGARVTRMVGLVTRARSLARGGERIQIQAADRGWFLEQCDVPLWFNFSATKSFQDLIDKLLRGPNGEDLGWGFQGADGRIRVASETDLYRRLNQGRAGIERSLITRAARGENPKAFVPPIQADVGLKIGETLRNYARRERKLINVASDGVLWIWQPNYQQDASYRIEYHADERRQRNNVLDLTVDSSVDGVPSDVTCVTVRSVPLKERTNEDPNADKIRGRFQAPAGTLPYYMLSTFGDSDQVGQSQAALRARWRYERAVYDANSIEAEVQGHSQGGLYWTPDTISTVDASAKGVSGAFYVSACRYMRDQGGTRTRVTLHPPGLLAA